ncbi:DegT/DnrJ/EryC1/StrS family aminotransferase [Sphingomonas hengshuiensis]|uniref:Aminotransferase DegT n=1 Tax=Sphingomonas hengshuiensis TaxID=1609977 RepID=A0A7U4J9H1_9SPHN|nr:DegT/DnrJ/EryC1/StrS family aminotransferase [Sphingomonas hengshuiensis]AJP72708.1 aminotransferase DegT [Sphingomonas hengshuiensis]
MTDPVALSPPPATEPKAGWIALSDPDFSEGDLAAVDAVLRGSTLSGGPMVERFEAAFAAYVGRRYAVAVSGGAIGLLLALQARGIGAGDEVILPAHGYREAQHAVLLSGATPIFADIDYWSGTIAPAKVEGKRTERTRAIVAANANGHPAAWPELRAIADAQGLALFEDSTEAIGSRHAAGIVGSFGDVAVFDFAQPGAICCGEGGMLVTDDVDLAMALRRSRRHAPGDRISLSITTSAPYGVGMSEIAAALALSQLRRIDVILERRRLITNLYDHFIQSFEGIKPPYVAPDVVEAHWFLYVVHLGTRFTRSGRDQIIEDLATEDIAAEPYSVPMHLQARYRALGWAKGDLFVTEKVADRAIALPFHAHLTDDQIAFVVSRMKESSINSGAGTPIY